MSLGSYALALSIQNASSLYFSNESFSCRPSQPFVSQERTGGCALSCSSRATEWSTARRLTLSPIAQRVRVRFLAPTGVEVYMFDKEKVTAIKRKTWIVVSWFVFHPAQFLHYRESDFLQILLLDTLTTN